MALDVDSLIRRLGEARNNRATWDNTFQQIAERVLPQMADFTSERSDGARRTEIMFDSTAALAATKAVAALSAFIWPSNQRYQKLTTSDKALNKVHRVKVYLDALTDTVFEARYSPRAAFEAQMGESALQFMVFGTGLMFVDDDVRRRALRYRALHLGRSWIMENAGGQVDTVFRCWKMTLRQIQAKWPGRLPPKLAEQLPKKPDELVEVAHVVQPREDYDPGMPGGLGKPWASCYFIPSEKHVIDENGFRAWPFATMRYMAAPGEVYGRSPAWLALPNIRVLNTQKRTSLAVAQKLADPPLLAHEDGILGAFSQAPGHVNYGGLSATGEQLVKPLVSGGKLEITLEMMDKEREIIASAFLLDVFRVLVENPQMTATQALELLNERAILMAPIGGRIESEGLAPLTEREIDLLEAAGQLPEMPPELIEAGGEYRFEWTSPMRRAMRSSDAIAITRTLEAVLPLAETDPSVLDPFDLEAASREIAEINGVPAKVMRSPEAVQAMREGRQQQQELTAAIEAAPAVSAAAANLAKLQASGGLQPGV